MDWSRIKRKTIERTRPAGAYADLDELIRIQFKVRDFSFLPSQPVSSILSGRHSSRLRGRGLNFEELRHYLPGDDIRTIDWKVTARTRKPHVRVYSEERDRAVMLVVDQRINMFFGSRDKFKSVTAAQLAALSAWKGIDVGDRVGAVIFNDTEIVHYQPAKSQSNVMSILHKVVELNHQLNVKNAIETNEGMLNQAIEKALRLCPHDTLVIIISDFSGADTRTEELTARIAAHNDVLGLLVHDPLRQRPTGKRIYVSDGLSQIELDLSDHRTSEALVHDYQKEQDNITHSLRRLSAPLLMISNEGDVVQQVRRLLGVPGRV
jgi:uncharacterized protein (DUF58 family)